MRAWGIVALACVALGACDARQEVRAERSAPPASVAAAPPPAQPPAPRTYSVVAGDGWFGIAQKLGVSPARLMAVNGATAETVIHPAQMITVPDDALPIAPSAVSPVRPAPAPTLTLASPQPPQTARVALAATPDERTNTPAVAAVAAPAGQRIPFEGNGGGPTLCGDGTVSGSSGRGTCSHHGGVGGGSHHHGGGHRGRH